MSDRFTWFRHRLLPAALTAAGVTLVAAGLLTWTRPVTAGSPIPTPDGATARPAATRLAIPTLGTAPSRGSGNLYTETPAPSPTPTTRVATRVVVPALRIDLPVVLQPADVRFPYCNVAMRYDEGAFSRIGTDGTSYLYAHARTGMFLPLLERSTRADNGASLVGLTVRVYTSDDRSYLYEITKVLRHQKQAYISPDAGHTLALQTSEGPPKGYVGYTGLVLVVVAKPVSDATASHADAVPKAQPVVCE